MSVLPKIVLLGGVAYVAYRALAAGEAFAGELPGAGIFMRRADNGSNAALSASEVAEICAQADAEAGAGFDVGDLMAVAFVESSWRPAAYRYEQKVNDASYGLFQTLYATAQEMGYGGAPDGLFDPVESARYGVRYLAWCRDYMRGVVGRAPNWLEILSCYNGGPGNARKGWRAVDYHNKFVRARAGISA